MRDLVDVADAPPVAIDDRHTGVSDGNVEAARRTPVLERGNRKAGVSAASNIDGVRPSMTIRMTGFGPPSADG